MTRSILLSLFTFLLVMAMPSMSHATGTVKVGDKIPHNLELKDSKGKMRSFSDLKGKKGMTLVFIRSVEWCPFCQKQLIELNKNAKKFSEAGYPVVTVSYDALPQLEKFVTKNNPKMTMLSDPRSESIRAFGILNKANVKGTMSYGIPHPGVYIVDKNKEVQAKFFKKGYKDRPSSKELLAKIKELNPPPKPIVDNLEGLGEDPVIPGQDIIQVPEKVIDSVVPEGLINPTLSPIDAPAAMPDANLLPPATPVEAIPSPTEVPPVTDVMPPKVTVPNMPTTVIDAPVMPAQGIENAQ